MPIYIEKRRPEEKRSVRTRLTPSQGPRAGFPQLGRSHGIIYQLTLRAEGGCGDWCRDDCRLRADGAAERLGV